jgi:hypothetical protein
MCVVDDLQAFSIPIVLAFDAGLFRRDARPVTAKSRSAGSVVVGTTGDLSETGGYPLRPLRKRISSSTPPRPECGMSKKQRQGQADSESSSTGSADTLLQNRSSPRSFTKPAGTRGSASEYQVSTRDPRNMANGKPAHAIHKTSAFSKKRSLANGMFPSPMASPIAQKSSNGLQENSRKSSGDAPEHDAGLVKLFGPDASIDQKDSYASIMSSSKTPAKE